MSVSMPERVEQTSLVRSTRRLHLLDYHGVPYEVDHAHRPTGPLAHFPSLVAASRPDGPRLYWVDRDVPGGPAVAVGRGEHALDGLPLHGPVLRAELAAAWLGRHSGWHPLRRLDGPGRSSEVMIWHHDDGSVLLPFDPDSVAHAVLSESYHDAAPRNVNALRGPARQAYYRLRPLLPRSGQIALRRAFAGLQSRSPFPRWPIEPALHDFYSTVLGFTASVAGEPLPTLAAWPGRWTWCLVLTHDVETSLGYGALDPVRAIEERLGYRSCWNFVPRRYHVEAALVRALTDAGNEVGVHGLYHDGRELESLATWLARLPAIHKHAQAWAARGYRSPGTHRQWDLMALLDFDYDSSYPDTDPYEPMAGGCCSWLPYANRHLVELPITLPQDFTLFTLLRQRDETIWVGKAEELRRRGGMALLDSHPDYLVDRVALTAYEHFLAHFATDTSAWKALPGEVAVWWRRRAASRIVRDHGAWVVRGPAAEEAHVQLVG